MCMKINAGFRAFVKYTSLFCLMIFTLSSPARATVIDFDDIPYVPIDPESPQFYDVTVADQYLSEGLRIRGAYLGRHYPLEASLDNPQFLWGSNFMRMTFVGDQLPVYVAMLVSSVFDYANIINFYGPDGHLFEMITPGSMGNEPNEPYRENHPIEFTSLTGISEITFRGYFNMRWGTMVDNLQFESSVPASVPEPRLLLLFCVGLGLLVLSRRNRFV
jgi:hypothetical protein